MKLPYNEAVQKAITIYRQNDYAESVISAFRKTTNELRSYLDEYELSYTPDLARQWLDARQGEWARHKVKSASKALCVLSEITTEGSITNNIQPRETRIAPYDRLSLWARDIVDNFIAYLCDNNYRKSANDIRMACARFFIYIEGLGVSDPTGITNKIVKQYFENDGHVSTTSKSRYDNDVRRCLLYMADLGLLSDTVGLSLNMFVLPDLVLVADLPENEQSYFERFLNPPENEIGMSLNEYDKAAKKLKEIYRQRQYSKSIGKVQRQALRDFRIFIKANNVAYSNDLALAWLDFQHGHWSRMKYLSFRKALLNINELIRQGSLSTVCFPTNNQLPESLGWAGPLLERYMAERVREGCAPSTLAMTENACKRFIRFLLDSSVTGLEGITPTLIKSFQLNDEHGTVEGKNAYSIKIRGFIRFLSRAYGAKSSLELAVSTETAPRVAIVTVLTKEQVISIYDYRKNASRPVELRNIAIVMLGLRMGIRISDITNLKMKDISWKDSAISFIQQKTGVSVKLPIPADAGNSLYQYIRAGRPKCESEYVFVHHRAPYCQFHSHAFGRVLNHILNAGDESKKVKGFHITRKTFASNMLAAGKTVESIAEALGHSNTETVDEYLAVDEERMRQCPIGLAGIEYSGEAGL